MTPLESLKRIASADLMYCLRQTLRFLEDLFLSCFTVWVQAIFFRKNFASFSFFILSLSSGKSFIEQLFWLYLSALVISSICSSFQSTTSTVLSGKYAPYAPFDSQNPIPYLSSMSKQLYTKTWYFSITSSKGTGLVALGLLIPEGLIDLKHLGLLMPITAISFQDLSGRSLSFVSLVFQLFQTSSMSTFLVRQFKGSQLGIRQGKSVNHLCQTIYCREYLFSAGVIILLSRSLQLLERLGSMGNQNLHFLMFSQINYNLSHQKGALPTSRQKIMTPKDQTSVSVEYPHSLRIQGEMQLGVPQIVLFFYPQNYSLVARPKSPILGIRLWLKKMLLDFMSR